MITIEEAEIRSNIIKAMAHPVRLMIVEYLKDSSRSFSEIFSLFALDKSTVSKHLLVLKEAGLDRKSTRLNSSHLKLSRMPSSA